MHEASTSALPPVSHSTGVDEPALSSHKPGQKQENRPERGGGGKVMLDQLDDGRKDQSEFIV